MLHIHVRWYSVNVLSTGTTIICSLVLISSDLFVKHVRRVPYMFDEHVRHTSAKTGVHELRDCMANMFAKKVIELALVAT